MTEKAATGRDRAVLWSLAGHGLLVLLVLIGGIVLPRVPTPTQLAIKATVVDPAASKPPRAPPRTEPEARPAPAPEPAPRPDPRREEQRAEEARQADQRREQQQQEEAARRAKAQAEKLRAEQARVEKARAEQAEKAQAARRRAEQELAEKQRQEKAAAERARADAEAARQKREEAARRQAANDLARQLAEEEELLAAADSGALADYLALIRQKVQRNWVRPPSAKPGLECEIFVTQIPGGQVTAVRMGTCNADDAVRRSIEAAVLKASPLPLPDEAALFERNLRFIFKPEQ